MSLQEVFLVNHSSVAGQRKGADDNRYLWPTCSGPYMRSGPIGSLVRTLLASSRWYSPVRRLKWEVNPPLFGESEPVFKRRQQYVVETICRDLEREGYSVQPVLIPGLVPSVHPHRRDRVWFIAHRDGHRTTSAGAGQQAAGTTGDNPWNASANASGNRDTMPKESGNGNR